MNMKVERASYYDGRFPLYDIPFEVGCFSIDGKGKYHDDGHQLKYLSMPDTLSDLYMDLNEGYQDYIQVLEDTEDTYSTILKWILSHQDLVRKHFVARFNSPKIDFVLFRGLLTSVSSTIYENREDWMIYATKFRSVIYLRDVKTERKMKERTAPTGREKRMTSWGFKFEQYMVSDTVNSEPDTSVPVNENEKYYAVFKGKLGNHRILFSAEVDCEDTVQSGNGPTSPLRYVELKTNRIFTPSSQEYRRVLKSFRRFKLLKWYLQSRFTGVPRVIAGFRDDEGIVRELEVFNVNEIPVMARGLWSPAACFNFLSHFLDHVKQHVTEDGVVYKFYWGPESDVIACEKLDEKFAVLPEWYTSEVAVI